MPNTKNRTERLTTSVAGCVKTINSIQNDLIYLSFYGEEALFNENLDNLVQRYRDLYQLDSDLRIANK